MKKYSLLKAIGIIMIIFMLMTWGIQASYFLDGKFTISGYDPMGIFDLLFLPFRFFNWESTYSLTNTVQNVSPIDGILCISYVETVLALLSIGIFYKVLNKTGSYGNLVDDIVRKMTGAKELFIIILMVLFTLLSSLTGLTLLLFLFVPFCMTILLKLEVPRIKVLAATMFPILIGRACSLLAWNVTGVNNAIHGVLWNDNLIIRMILLLIFMGLSIVYVLFFNRKEEPKDTKNKIKKIKEEIQDPLYDGVVKKEKSYVPMIFLVSVFTIISAVCMYNLYYVFDNTSLTESFANLKSMTLSNYPIISNILGTIEPFGYWSGFTLSAILLLLSVLLSFIYSLKFEDMIDAIKEGIITMLKPALYVILASFVIVFINAKSANIFYTIAEWINNNITIEPVSYSAIVSSIYGIFVNDFTMMSQQMTNVLSQYFVGNAYSLSVLCFQTFYGIISIVAPTSIILVPWLSYLDIPYKKWLSYIWKLVLCLFTLALLILLIVSFV